MFGSAVSRPSACLRPRAGTQGPHDGRRDLLRCQRVAHGADLPSCGLSTSAASTAARRGRYDGSMRFKRYLAVMGATSVTAAALVAGFTLLVDPLGISPIRIAIAGFNEWKPLRRDYDRIVKPYDVARSLPRTIFVGSSRIKQTIDPRLLAGTRFAPAYNAGINGSADYEELNSYLQYYIRADNELRHVFIEAFASAMFSDEPGSRTGTPLKPMMRLGLKEYVADFGSVFFSVNGLNSAVRSAWLNRRRARDHWVLPRRIMGTRLCAGCPSDRSSQCPQCFQFRASQRGLPQHRSS